MPCHTMYSDRLAGQTRPRPALRSGKQAYWKQGMPGGASRALGFRGKVVPALPARVTRSVATGSSLVSPAYVVMCLAKATLDVDFDRNCYKHRTAIARSQCVCLRLLLSVLLMFLFIHPGGGKPERGKPLSTQIVWIAPGLAARIIRDEVQENVLGKMPCTQQLGPGAALRRLCACHSALFSAPISGLHNRSTDSEARLDSEALRNRVAS